MEATPITKIYEEQWRPRFIRSMSPGLTFNDEMRNATRFLRARPGEMALDVACGSGLYTRPLAQLIKGESARHTGHIIGVDISVPMLKEAARLARQESIENITYVRADVNALPFGKTACFDHITCMAAFHLFPKAGAVAIRLAALLKPGGNLVMLTTRSSRKPLFRMLEKSSEPISGLRFFDAEELDDILRAAGLVPNDKRVFGAMAMIEARKPG